MSLGVSWLLLFAPLAMSAGPARRWPVILLTLLALAGAYLGASGLVMAGSFKAASPWPPPAGHEAYYDRLAARYAALLGGSLLLLAGLLLRVLLRLWRRPPGPSAAS